MTCIDDATSESSSNAANATTMAERLIRALAQHTSILLSEADLGDVLPALQQGFLAAGAEMAAYLELEPHRGEHGSWRLRDLQCDERYGQGGRSEISRRIRASLSHTDLGWLKLGPAGAARTSPHDSCTALAPVFCDRDLCGLLWVEASPEAWAPDSLRALGSVAMCLGQAIKNRANLSHFRERLTQQEALVEAGLQISQRMNELELVHQVAIATARLVDIDKLLQETTTFIVERIYPDVFGFVLRDSDSGGFKPHPSFHGLPVYGLGITVPMEHSITGEVARTGQPKIVNDVAMEALYFSVVPETRSEVAVPMISEGTVIGVINVESRKRDAFGQSDLRFLMTLAGQVATAIERARLYADLQQHAGQLAEEVNRRTLELQWERDRMLAILDSAGEGIMFTDVNSKILYVNRALESQIGYSREECLGARPSMWRSPETNDMVFQEMQETLRSGKRWRGEVKNLRKDGTTFDAALTITPLYDNDGNLSGFVVVQADISRLKEVDRLKSKFIANVSHELRTPLTNIRNYTSLLERGSLKRREKYIAVIKKESDRLTRLIQDLLDLSRLDANVRRGDLQAIDISEFVHEATTTFAPQAERRSIALSCAADEPLPAVMASRAELQQVVSNLLGNALAYTPSGGRVLVSAGAQCRQPQPMVWIRVEDNGPGIRPEELPRLFDRFYRGEAARQSGAPGTGLGLSICKEILDIYGGRLEIDSVPGEGTLFTVWLPGRIEHVNE